MTTYAVDDEGGITLKVTYEDPAGAFAGWFLHVLHGINVNMNGGGSGAASALGVNGTKRQLFFDSVNARLARMFGSESLVTWAATIVEDVTPAVIDEVF